MQKIYQKHADDIIVVGVAFDRDTAFELVEQIVSEASLKGENIPIKEFFEESR